MTRARDATGVRQAPSVRAATSADLPAIAAIIEATDDPVDWPDLPGWPYLEHLLSRARVLVAESGGAVAGFGGSIPVGDSGTRFLTDLFVDPSSQERGLGHAILDAALDGATAAMTFSSADQRALGLYLRAGMRPWWPLLYLAGHVGPTPDPTGDTLSFEAADVSTTAAWTETWTGVDRAIDFRHYASLPEAQGILVRDGDAVVAVGWARRARQLPGRWLDHASFAPGADPLRVGLRVWQAAAQGGRLTAAIPGPHPVVPMLLEAGVRILDRDTFCASDPALLDPVRTFPNPALG